MLSGDRLVCVFVNPQTVETQFTTWFLHVTIVPWFRLAESSDCIVGGLTRALTTISPFTLLADGEAMFGPHQTRHVRLLKQSTQLVNIETKVRTYLHKKRALLIDETTKRRPSFRPHVTNQGYVGLRADDVFVCDRLYVVEQCVDYKEIVGEVMLV